MRTLLLPVYTNPTIRTCTSYIFARNFILEAVAEDPNAYFYLPIPKETEFDFADVKHPRVKLLPMSLTTRSAAQVPSLATIPPEAWDAFNDFSGKYPVDAILTTSPLVIPEIHARWYSHRAGNSVRPILGSFMLFGMGEESDVPDSFRHLQTAGLALCDITVWQSKTSFDRVRKLLTATTRPTAVANVISTMLPGSLTSVPIARIDAVPRIPKPTDKWVVNYGYSLAGVYNFQELFEIVDSLFCAGYPIKVQLSTSSAAKVLRSDDIREKFEKRYDHYFDFTKALPQAEFWSRASQAHAFLFMATNAESSFSVLEQFVLGMVGVFRDSPYAREVTYPGYPYIFRTAAEIATATQYVLEHYGSPDVQEVLTRQQEFVRANFDTRVVYRKQWAQIRAQATVNRSGEKVADSITQMLADHFKGRNQVTWDEFVKAVKEESKYGSDIEDSLLLARCKSTWILCLERAGWVDDCQGEMPNFVSLKC